MLLLLNQVPSSISQSVMTKQQQNYFGSTTLNLTYQGQCMFLNFPLSLPPSLCSAEALMGDPKIASSWPPCASRLHNPALMFIFHGLISSAAHSWNRTLHPPGLGFAIFWMIQSVFRNKEKQFANLMLLNVFTVHSEKLNYRGRCTF